MALTKIGTDGIKDDAVTTDKVANAINTSIAANTAKDLTALSASNLTSGTIPDARFPATLPAASAANLTAVPAANITGTLPAISAANLTSIPAANITGTLPAISGANLTNLPASGKATNLVINGAMNVAQRGTSSTSGGYRTLDRFKAEGGANGVTTTQSQQDLSSSDTPYSLGFRKYFRVALSGAGTANTNAYVEMQQRIEAQNIATSGWDYTSSSSNITLQFWFRASTNQTFYAYLYSFDGTKQVYTFSFTASGNNTWTKITKTIPGNSNLTFDNDNGPGMQIKFMVYYGTVYSNNKTLDQWGAYDSANQLPDMASTWLTAGASTFDLTGLQLEVGDTASDFAHESLQDTL